MRSRDSDYAVAAIIITVLFLAVAVGALFISLAEDADDPTYSLSSEAEYNGAAVGCSGTVSYDNYDESDTVETHVFTLKASCGDDSVDDMYTVFVSTDTDLPIDSLYAQTGADGDCTVWTYSDTVTSGEDGTATYWIDSDGGVAKMTVEHNGYTYTVTRD